MRPTVFSDVTNDMTIAREEIFGPVLSIITYRDEEEAIAIANDTSLRLAGLRAVRRCAAGARAWRRASRPGGSSSTRCAHDPAAPFGGLKQSGIGREYGVYGLEAFLETKAVLNVPAYGGPFKGLSRRYKGDVGAAGLSPPRHGAPAAPTGRTW